MATQEEIYKIITDTLINDFEIEPDEIKDGVDIYKDLDLDSLDAIDLMVTLDKKFGIETKPEAMHSISTIEELCKFITEAVAAK